MGETLLHVLFMSKQPQTVELLSGKKQNFKARCFSSANHGLLHTIATATTASFSSSAAELAKTSESK